MGGGGGVSPKDVNGLSVNGLNGLNGFGGGGGGEGVGVGGGGGGGVLDPAAKQCVLSLLSFSFLSCV